MELPLAGSGVFVANLAFTMATMMSPLQQAWAASFPSLKPRVPIIQEPMIEDLIHCLCCYAEVPRKI